MTARPAAGDPVAALRRPLRIPTLPSGGRCPAACRHEVDAAFAAVLGDGPAYPTDSAGDWWADRAEGGWYYWLNWPSYTRLRAGGCYAYQVDGATSSRVIVFRA